MRPDDNGASANGASAAHHTLDQPSAWVARFAPLIRRGEVLDLACGGGRHARLLAALGHRVVALDRDAAALQRCEGERIETLLCDLEIGDPASSWPFEAERFGAIVVTNYLHRPLFPFLFQALAPSGVLIYETFAAGNGRFGKPSSPAFLLRPGELLEQAQAYRAEGIRVIAYEDGYVALPRPAMIQRICAVKVDGVAPDETLYALGT